MAITRFETWIASKPYYRNWKRRALLVKWFTLTLALSVFFTELLTHGLGDDEAPLGFGWE